MDILFGDPPWFPHPVRGIGWLIKKSEGAFRGAIKDERLSGAVFASVIIIFTWSMTFVITRRAYSLSCHLGMLVSIIIIYTSLSIKDLAVESLAVFDALDKGQLNNARTALSKIVGRDTANLSEREIARAAVETVAENIVDGIISPLFYAFLGGAPLAMAYKAVNTLDSTIGYKNKEYMNFGRPAARIDDIANFIPARLSVIFLVTASGICGYNPIRTWKIAMRDGGKNPSPNSGLPEAAIAGALGIRLGGLNYYNSAAVQKPFIGDENSPMDRLCIKEAVKIAYVTAGLFVIAGAALFRLV